MSNHNHLSAETLGWKAKLDLVFENRINKSVLAKRTQYGPLSVQRPFYPEGEVCHLYLLHPPGGVVGGDELRLNVHVKKHAKVLITTPGATKFYRSAGKQSKQIQKLTVSDGSSLEWFPQENIFFDQTHTQLHTRVELEQTAKFIGWEINCYGRPAANELFNSGQITTRLAVFREQRPILLDSLNLASFTDVETPVGLNHYACFGTLIATQITPQLLEKARQAIATEGERPIGMTLLDDVLIVRCLGHYAEHVSSAFKTIWATLRKEVLDKQACPPRIWLT